MSYDSSNHETCIFNSLGKSLSRARTPMIPWTVYSAAYWLAVPLFEVSIASQTQHVQKPNSLSKLSLPLSTVHSIKQTRNPGVTYISSPSLLSQPNHYQVLSTMPPVCFKSISSHCHQYQPKPKTPQPTLCNSPNQLPTLLLPFNFTLWLQRSFDYI